MVVEMAGASTERVGAATSPTCCISCFVAEILTNDGEGDLPPRLTSPTLISGLSSSLSSIDFDVMEYNIDKKGESENWGLVWDKGVLPWEERVDFELADEAAIA